MLNRGALEDVGGPAGTRVRERERKYQVIRGRQGRGEGGDGGGGWVWGWGGILHVWESSATRKEGGRAGGMDGSSLLWYACEAYNIAELSLLFTFSYLLYCSMYLIETAADGRYSLVRSHTGHWG